MIDFSAKMPNFVLDRDRLHDAVNMCTARKLYAWSKTLKTPPKLDSIGIKNVGHVKLPLDIERTLQVCNRLKNPLTRSWSGPIIVSAADIYDTGVNQNSHNQIFKELAAIAMSEMFNVDTQHFIFNVTAKLDKFVICFDDGLYKDLFNIEKQPGTFGSLILQVPVSGGIGGACISVQYDKETMLMEHDVCSETNYYLSAIAGKSIDDLNARQEFTIKSSNGRHCVLLIANLIWEDVVNSSPTIEADRLPQFIEAAYQTNRALSGWRHLTNKSTAEQMWNDEAHFVHTNAINPTGHFFIESLVDEKLPLLDASQTKALIIPLRGNYCIDNYNLPSLTGDDGLISRVLTSIKYLTVELVLIKKTSVPNTDWRESALLETQENIRVFKPLSRVDVESLPISLVTGENFVGNFKGGVSCLDFGRAKCTSCSQQRHCRLFYGAFLVQPRFLQKMTTKPLPTFSLNHLIHRTPDAGVGYEETLALIEDLISREVRSKVIGMFNANGWKLWRRTLFFEILMDTHISRTFRGLALLAVECHSSNCYEGIAQILVTMVALLFKSINSGGSKTSLHHLLDLVKAYETLIPSQSNVLQSVKETLDNLTAAHLASMIEANKGVIDNGKYLETIARTLLEKNLNDVTPSQIFGVMKTFLSINDMETVTSLWKKVCDDASKDGQPLQSMIMTPKEDAGRVALVAHLASFSEFTKEALDFVVEKLEMNSSITADSLCELFLFSVSAQSNESLASETRMKSLLSFLTGVDHEIQCHVFKKLCRDPLRKQAKALELLKELIEGLIGKHFEKVLQLDREAVADFVDSVIWLKNQDLIDVFIRQFAMSNGNGAAICFHSRSLHYFIIDLVHKSEKVERNVIHLLKLWIRNVLHYYKKLEISAITLSKAFLHCCFTEDSEENDRTIHVFERLISKLNPVKVFKFLVEIYEKNPNSDDKPYSSVLLAACRMLSEETEFLTRISLEKKLLLVKIAHSLDDDSTTYTLIKNVLSNEATSNGDVRKQLEDRIGGPVEKLIEKCEQWSIRDAVVASNQKLEIFLRSIRQRQLFGRPFESKTKAEALGYSLVQLSRGLTRFTLIEENALFVCELIKTQKFASFAMAVDERTFKINSSIKSAKKERPSVTHFKSIPKVEDEKLSAIGKETMETWRIEDAVVKNNTALQMFLRSDLQSQGFPAKPFQLLAQAQCYRCQLLSQTVWPVDVEIVGTDGAYFCHVTKIKMKRVPIVDPSLINNPVNPTQSCYAHPNKLISDRCYGNEGEPPMKRLKTEFQH